MKMIAFSAFYDHLLPELPGCTPALLDLHLREVARDYCSQAHAWIEPLSPIAIDASTDTYPLFPPRPKTDTVRLLKMMVGDDLYWQAIEPQLDPRQLRFGVRALGPRYRSDQPPFTISNAGAHITFTVPIDGPEVVFTASIKPTLDATTLPDFLLSDQLDAIRSGVLARLMRMGGKSWTDRDLARAYDSEFTGWKHRKGTEALRGNQGALLRTTKTPF